MKAKIACNIQQRNPDVPECTMSITVPDESVTKNLLSVCHRICQHQAVTNLDILIVICEDLMEFLVSNIGKNIESLKIRCCELPTETLSHLMQQINGCSTLRVLDLSWTTVTGCFSGFLPEPHPGLPKIEVLNLWETELYKDDLQHLLSMTYKLPKLHKLDLSHKTLTGCLSSFLPDPHPGLPVLEELKLSRTALNKEDLKRLFSIIQLKKLPKLQVLDLSDNSLTGSLSRFLPDPHPGLPELEKLCLINTQLNKKDLQHLSHITQYNKLPLLRCLGLSGNTLTGCLSCVIPDNHQGLPQLEELNLWNTALNKDDLKHLSHITQSNKLPKVRVLDLSQITLMGCLSSLIPDNHYGLPKLEGLGLVNSALNQNDLTHLSHLIQTHKLPGLKDLNLWRNRLSEMETDVEHLIEACVNHHQRELVLGLWINGLSDAFEKKWEQRCAGTKIKLLFQTRLVSQTV